MQKVFLGLLFAALATPGVASAASESLETQLHKLGALVSFLERELNYVDPTLLSAEEMRDIAIDGTRFLQNAQEENGHFAYEYAPYEDHYLPGDNIVRQAGALFQLGEVAWRDSDSSLDVGATIKSAIEYFENLSRKDSVDDTDVRCVVEDEDSRRCKLGATALALVGVLGYVEANPDEAEEYDALIDDYASYILASQKDEGGFRYIHRVGSDSQSDRESSFSNGEALLALVRYYQYEPKEEFKEAAQSAYDYLEAQEFDTASYLWVMAALKDMQTLWPDERYAAYARSFTDWRVAGVARNKYTKHNYCAYTEGVVSAYSVLEDTSTPAQRQSLRGEIDFWNTKNSTLQIKDAERYRYRLEDGKLQLLEIPDISQARGGFLTGQDALTQRIDFTQHCISAYLQVLVDIDRQRLE